MTVKEAIYAFPRGKYPKLDGFDEMYKKITGDKTPEIVYHGVLPLEDYVKQFELFYGHKPEIIKKSAGTLGNIEFTTGLPEKQVIIVLENSKDFLFESLSHGIGHVKYNLESYKKYDLLELQLFTEYTAREVAANLATQKIFNKGNQHEYIETPFYIETQKCNPVDEVPKELTEKLIKKFGVNTAFEKSLNLDTIEDINGLLEE